MMTLVALIPPPPFSRITTLQPPHMRYFPSFLNAVKATAEWYWRTLAENTYILKCIVDPNAYSAAVRRRFRIQKSVTFS